MKVLVTGATGFIGSHVVRRFVDDGHLVLALLRSPAKAKVLPRENVEFLEGDLSIFKQPGLKLPPCDAVVHLAAALTVKDQSEYDATSYQPVVDMVRCLEAQDWTPRRFVFASTLSAGGPTRPVHPLTEESPSRPVDEYGKAKLKAEKFIESAPFPTTAFRPGMVMGPRDTACLNLFQIADKGLGFKVKGLDQQICFIYAEDLAEAVVAMAGDTEPGHKMYYVTSEDFIDTRQLWKTVGDAMGKKLFLIEIPKPVLRGLVDVFTVASRIFEFNNRLDRKKYHQMTEPAFLCTSAKIKKELGWEARHDFKSAVRLTLDWYKKEGWL